jgi:hypothetical protein
VAPDIWEDKAKLYKPILQTTSSSSGSSSCVRYKLQAVLLHVSEHRSTGIRPTASEAKIRMDINNTEVEMPTAWWAGLAFLYRLWEIMGSNFGSEDGSSEFLSLCWINPFI